MKPLPTTLFACALPLLMFTLIRETGLFRFNYSTAHYAKWCTSSAQPNLWLGDAERIDVVCDGRLIRSEYVAAEGDDAVQLNIIGFWPDWSISQYVPLFKRGKSRFFVVYEIAGPHNQRAYELVSFWYDIQVIGPCSTFDYRETLLRDVNATLVAQLRQRIEFLRSEAPVSKPLPVLLGETT